MKQNPVQIMAPRHAVKPMLYLRRSFQCWWTEQNAIIPRVRLKVITHTQVISIRSVELLLGIMHKTLLVKHLFYLKNIRMSLTSIKLAIWHNKNVNFLFIWLVMHSFHFMYPTKDVHSDEQRWSFEALFIQRWPILV